MLETIITYTDHATTKHPQPFSSKEKEDGLDHPPEATWILSWNPGSSGYSTWSEGRWAPFHPTPGRSFWTRLSFALWLGHLHFCFWKWSASHVSPSIRGKEPEMWFVVCTQSRSSHCWSFTYWQYQDSLLVLLKGSVLRYPAFITKVLKGKDELGRPLPSESYARKKARSSS